MHCLSVLLDGSIVVEEGSPELLHGDNIWFSLCDNSVILQEGSHFEICLAGFHDRRLVFDKVNGHFKVTMFPEQLTAEYHHMKVQAIVYRHEVDDQGQHYQQLIIRPHTNDTNKNKKYMLSIDKVKRFRNRQGNRSRRSLQMKEVGRVSMVKVSKNWHELEHVKLEMMFK